MDLGYQVPVATYLATEVAEATGAYISLFTVSATNYGIDPIEPHGAYILAIFPESQEDRVLAAEDVMREAGFERSKRIFGGYAWRSPEIARRGYGKKARP